MKIYFDTNVIISAFLTKGTSFEVIVDAIGFHEIYYTDFLIEELKKVFKEKFCFSKQSIDEKINFIKQYFIKGRNAIKLERICRDVSDNRILSDAIFNQIDLLVTGDSELLEIKQYKRLKIISPDEYWLLR